MVIPDMSTHPLFADLNWTGSIIGIPLKIGPRVVGVMTVCRRPEREFSTEDLYAFQSLADQAAMTIENIRLHSLSAEQVRIDASTGLHNRRALNEHLEAEVVAAVEGQFPFALFLLNLDGFDEINQRYGRSAGDFLLAETATAVAKDLRKTDFIARFDASRYSLVLDRTDRSTASAIADRILDIIARRRFSLPEKGARKVSISIGAAVFPDDGTTPDRMVEAAKLALDQACTQPGSVAFASQSVETGAAHPAP
jgi:diguanylate cyclase (GGDEF)-like protein